MAEFCHRAYMYGWINKFDNSTTIINFSTLKKIKISILQNYLNMSKAKLMGALPVASSLFNLYINFHSEWTKND